MGNVSCYRCGNVAYATPTRSSIPLAMRDDPNKGTVITETVKLCGPCRAKAGHENEVAKGRVSKR